MINNRQNNRRRGRGGGGGGGGPRPNGPNNGGGGGNRIDNRARGNASQLHEKYKTLARDMQTQGDRVMTEYYLQFADHYYRILNENRARFEEQRPRRDDQADREEQDEFGYDTDIGVAAREQPREQNRDQGRDQARESAPRQPAFELGSKGEEDEQPRRRGRNGNGNGNGNCYAAASPGTNGHAPQAAEEGEQPRAPRGRRRREGGEEAQSDRIELAVLPPAFSASAPAPAEDVAEDAPKPKRRGRPPKVPAAEA